MAQVVGLQKSYKLGKQTIPALSGADLTVYEGEFVALTGPSGSGKSTLLQLIGGLDKPTSGSIVVDGVDIAKLSDTALSHFRNTTIGFVFQFFYLQPFLSLARNIEVPAMFAGGDRRARQQRVASLLEQVGLSDRATHLPKELSGGQMQRAAIARALLNQPKLLLADEPTGNLDSANSQSIVDLFDDIRTKYGTTIIVVTHDRSIARRADRTVSLVDGKVAA
ncbi:macrolide ABC transporter ATP-binding protein [Candidatus Saccharibacteria bacterium]|nr:MAG: macrolide ABC transporter ATP-binding protein [Candidatus Saccharibacteria bacterium]